jgi:hypothetical protein
VTYVHDHTFIHKLRIYTHKGTTKKRRAAPLLVKDTVQISLFVYLLSTIQVNQYTKLFTSESTNESRVAAVDTKYSYNTAFLGEHSSALPFLSIDIVSTLNRSYSMNNPDPLNDDKNTLQYFHGIMYVCTHVRSVCAYVYAEVTRFFLMNASMAEASLSPS